MKLKTKQKLLGGISGFLLLLIITNPSAQAFKEYVGSNSYYGLYRERNFFVASIYRYEGDEYVAVIGNFIEENKQMTIISDKAKGALTDSTAAADSASLKYHGQEVQSPNSSLKDPLGILIKKK